MAFKCAVPVFDSDQCEILVQREKGLPVVLVRLGVDAKDHNVPVHGRRREETLLSAGRAE